MSNKRWGKFLSVVLALVLGISVFSMPALAAVNPANPTGTTPLGVSGGGGWVFLHGNAVVIADGKTEGTTKIYVDTNANGVIDEGEEAVTLNETGTAEDGYDLSNTAIYALGDDSYPQKYTSHTGDTLITMTGGKVRELNGAVFVNSIGDFDLNMTGGEVTEKICAGSHKSRDGSVNINIGGDAKIGQAIYGGSENGGCTTSGNVNIIVGGNAKVGGKTYAQGVYGAGQQPGDAVQGKIAITVKENAYIEGTVAGNLYNGDRLQDVEINVQGGTIKEGIYGVYGDKSAAKGIAVNMSGGDTTGNIMGCRNGAVAESVAMGFNGGICNSLVIGNYQGIVNGNVSTTVAGGTLSAGYNGVREGNASAVNNLFELRSGRVGAAVQLNVGSVTVTSADLKISGGTVNGTAEICATPTTTAPNASSIQVSGSPTFGESGKIRLRQNEVVTATGDINSDSGVKIDEINVNTAGTLVVQPAGGITLDKSDYKLVQNTYQLLFGASAQTNNKLWLGTEKTADADKGNLVISTEIGEGAPQSSSNLAELEQKLLKDVQTSDVIAQGTDVHIKLYVENADDTVTEDVKGKIAAYNEKWEKGQYLDIVVKKYVNAEFHSDIKKLPETIKITIDIPQGLLKEGREYTVLKVHEEDGTLTVTELPDLDNTVGTYTFETDSFSIYSLMYYDQPYDQPVTGVTLDKTEATITTAGGTEQLTATVMPENAVNKNVTWSSSDESVAAVDASGKVTAKKNGTVTITVTTEDGQHKETCIIVVNISKDTSGGVTTPGNTTTPGVEAGSPQTGDHSSILFYAILLLLSGVGMASIVLVNRKHRNSTQENR